MSGRKKIQQKENWIMESIMVFNIFGKYIIFNLKIHHQLPEIKKKIKVSLILWRATTKIAKKRKLKSHHAEHLFVQNKPTYCYSLFEYIVVFRANSVQLIRGFGRSTSTKKMKKKKMKNLNKIVTKVYIELYFQLILL